MAKDHVGLVQLLTDIESVCSAIVDKDGTECGEEVERLKREVPKFVAEMREHLKEEEETFPPLLRANFTQEEDAAIVQEILKKEGLHGTRIFVPSILAAMDNWATPKFKEDFLASFPPPILHRTTKYYVPDYETFVQPKRDAPTLSSKPDVGRVPCFQLPFCFPCIV